MKMLLCLLGCIILSGGCQKKSVTPDEENREKFYSYTEFAMGVDLSYVNQVEDHGGIYRDSGEVRDPFRILKSHGANMVRVRLWHNPQWVREVYGDPSKTLYSGYADVEKAIQRAKQQGMAVNLNFHYSDFWADPGHQNPPAAWKDIKSLEVLKDSVYNYTYSVLRKLESKGLMPEMVQIGNETNCGMMMTGTVAGFPSLNGCNGQWANLGAVLNSGIKAVRDVAAISSVKPRIALHVADPKNVEWWFQKVITDGKVTDFDVVGFSYYFNWHTEVTFAALPILITKLKNMFRREVMILETAYPWTNQGNDGYNNILGGGQPLTGFPFTREGQLGYMQALTESVLAAGGTGIMYWEPAWITSGMKDSWGTGSSWENAAFFDFQGNLLPVARYMQKN
jgi:arabinogalactan endo-1,4-beta-galactosidase